MTRALLPLLLACTVPTAPSLGSPVTPPPTWRAEWEWTWATCAARWVPRPAVAFERVHWSVVPGVTFASEAGEVHGLWRPAERRIYLSAWAAEETATGWVRRHEMLHAMTGEMGHPVSLFEPCERAAAGAP